MKEKLIRIFEENKSESLTLPTIRKILGLKKKTRTYEKKNNELLAAINELLACNYLYKDDNNHYSKTKPITKKVSTKDTIIAALNDKKDITLSEIANITKSNNDELIPILKQMELDGILYYDDYTNRFYSTPSNFFVVKVECNKYGTLFYYLNNKVYELDDSLKLGIMPYDTILIEKNNGKNQPKTRIIKIIKRAIDKIVCEVGPQNTIRVVGNNTIPVKASKKEISKYPEGTRLLTSFPTNLSQNDFNVEIIKVLGHKNDLNAELEAIARNNGFETTTTEEELEQIRNMPKEVSDKERVGRLDLTKENIFTIDGAHTKDMDDAISIKVLENGNYELTVSIAHVSHYIKFGSPLWLRAEKNTTSVYLIDGVLHMLNFQVSNGICSLNPDTERLAKSYIMEIDSQGKIVKFNIANTIIKSKKKMTYEEVNEIFEQGKIPEGYEPFLDDLLKMHELSQIISNRRTRDGSIDFDSKEIVFELDEDQNITGVTTRKNGPAENLIENFMIMANQAVAEYMLNTGLLFIYRNHEIPFNDKVAETINIIKKIENQLESEDDLEEDIDKTIKRKAERSSKKSASSKELLKLKRYDDPHVIQKIINSLKTKEEFFILSGLILRSMQRASFSTENKGHFGLALPAYSQVTSPIRRFLDLLIEYTLDNIDMFYEENFDFDAWKEYLSKICERASNLERCADKAEYESNRLYMVDYVSARPDMEFDGYVSEITPRYITIKTPELIEGIVYFDDIDDGGYVFNPDNKSLDNKKTKSKILIGSKLKLKLKDYNREYRIIYFNATSLSKLKEQILTRTKN